MPVVVIFIRNITADQAAGVSFFCTRCRQDCLKREEAVTKFSFKTISIVVEGAMGPGFSSPLPGFLNLIPWLLPNRFFSDPIPVFR